MSFCLVLLFLALSYLAVFSQRPVIFCKGNEGRRREVVARWKEWSKGNCGQDIFYEWWITSERSLWKPWNDEESLTNLPERTASGMKSVPCCSVAYFRSHKPLGRHCLLIKPSICWWLIDSQRPFIYTLLTFLLIVFVLSVSDITKRYNLTENSMILWLLVISHLFFYNVLWDLCSGMFCRCTHCYHNLSFCLWFFSLWSLSVVKSSFREGGKTFTCGNKGRCLDCF